MTGFEESLHFASACVERDKKKGEEKSKAEARNYWPTLENKREGREKIELLFTRRKRCISSERGDLNNVLSPV